MAILAARRPNHSHQSAAQEPVSLNSHLAIVEAIILTIKRGPCKDFRRFLEIEAPLFERFVALRWIEGDLQRIIVATEM